MIKSDLHNFRQSSDGAFTDLYKVEGLRGIYIASKINRIPLSETISPDALVSLITFDHGATWRSITAPTTDDDGLPINNCAKDCSLHLSQKFSSLYPVTRYVELGLIEYCSKNRWSTDASVENAPKLF